VGPSAVTSGPSPAKLFPSWLKPVAMPLLEPLTQISLIRSRSLFFQKITANQTQSVQNREQT